MTLLLEQANLLSQDQLRAGVVEEFARNSTILERLDFLDVRGNAYAYNIEGALGGIAFRGVNESYTPSTGIINPMTETLKISGGDLIVDNYIVRTRGMNVRTAHEVMKIKSLARTITENFIKGNSTINPREPDGLARRITGSQEILAGAGGAALTQDMLDDLLAQVPSSNGLLMGTGTIALITKLLRASPQISTGVDAFGDKVTTYNGVPLINVGKNSANAEILAFNEDPDDGVFDTSSIYAVRFGTAESETDLFGLQNEGGMKVNDLGEMESKPALLTRVEWDVSYALASSDCVARLRGITNAIA